MAREAVAGGKVQCNGHRAKPGKAVKRDDRLSISRGHELFDITIVDISDRRVSAPLAREKYVEDPRSVERRAAVAEQMRIDRMSRTEPTGRPDKRDRQKIIRFTRKR